MSAVIELDPQAVRLDAIAGEIGDLAGKTVQNVWRIGTLLNEASAALGHHDFGAWRKEHVTEPYGIAARTCATFQSIARTYTAQELPTFLGITALADLASLPDTQRKEAQAYLASQAQDGKRVPVNVATSVVQRVRQGDDQEALAKRYDKAPGIEEVAPIAAQEAVEGELIPVAAHERQQRAPRQPVAPAAGEDDLQDFAKGVCRQIKRFNGTRTAALGALVDELRKAGLLEVEDNLTIGAEAGHIVVSK